MFGNHRGTSLVSLMVSLSLTAIVMLSLGSVTTTTLDRGLALDRRTEFDGLIDQLQTSLANPSQCQSVIGFASQSPINFSGSTPIQLQLPGALIGNTTLYGSIQFTGIALNYLQPFSLPDDLHSLELTIQAKSSSGQPYSTSRHLVLKIDPGSKKIAGCGFSITTAGVLTEGNKVCMDDPGSGTKGMFGNHANQTKYNAPGAPKCFMNSHTLVGLINGFYPWPVHFFDEQPSNGTNNISFSNLLVGNRLLVGGNFAYKYNGSIQSNSGNNEDNRIRLLNVESKNNPTDPPVSFFSPNAGVCFEGGNNVDSGCPIQNENYYSCQWEGVVKYNAPVTSNKTFQSSCSSSRKRVGDFVTLPTTIKTKVQKTNKTINVTVYPPGSLPNTKVEIVSYCCKERK